jgi:HPt (histidine-containing phosphotransfer) domain-containing protein
MAAHPPKSDERARDPSAGDAVRDDASDAGRARCDVLAVVRDCIDGRRASWEAKGIEAGIELPCGALPWFALDDAALRRMLEGVLDSVCKRLRGGSMSVALWWDGLRPGRGSLHVEAYADEPTAGMSLDVVLDEAPAAPRVPPTGLRGKALLVDEHPARGRILQAQCARLGMEAGEPVSVEVALEAAAATPHRFVWLGGLADAEIGALAAALRRTERKRRFARARIVALRDAAAGSGGALPEVDAMADWPLSLDRLRALCSATPWPDGDALEATRRLFLRESRRDAAIIREAIAAADWATVIRHAHRIKGGTVVLGQDDICARAERVEQAARRAVPDAMRLSALLAALEKALQESR